MPMEECRLVVLCPTVRVNERGNMKHNLTAEQIVYVMFGLLITVSLVYVWIEGIKEKYYAKGYVHGWNRSKATYRQSDTR